MAACFWSGVIYLKGRSYRIEGETEAFHLPVHSPNGDWDWARLNQEPGASGFALRVQPQALGSEVREQGAGWETAEMGLELLVLILDASAAGGSFTHCATLLIPPQLSHLHRLCLCLLQTLAAHSSPAALAPPHTPFGFLPASDA